MSGGTWSVSSRSSPCSGANAISDAGDAIPIWWPPSEIERPCRSDRLSCAPTGDGGLTLLGLAVLDDGAFVAARRRASTSVSRSEPCNRVATCFKSWSPAAWPEACH